MIGEFHFEHRRPNRNAGHARDARRVRGALGVFGVVGVLLAVALGSCGWFSPGRSTSQATNPSLPPLPRLVASSPDGSVGEPRSPAVSASAAVSVSAAGSLATLPIGFDALPNATVAAASTIGVLAYGVMAAADPYRITISPAEQHCLTAVGPNLSDEAIDAALAWNEADGMFADPVRSCLTPENRESFAVWHRMDNELADADDAQYHCVERGLASGATLANLTAALGACGINPPP